MARLPDLEADQVASEYRGVLERDTNARKLVGQFARDCGNLRRQPDPGVN